MRLIKADALMEITNQQGYLTVDDILNAPTIDAVQVVRCRDCEKYRAELGWCDEHSHFIDADREFCHPYESTEWKMFEPDDFCSYGERKDGVG